MVWGGRRFSIQGVLFAVVLVAVGWTVVLLVRYVHRQDRVASAERRAHEVAGARVARALESAGGLPDRPIEVQSAAAIEPRAESGACVLCGRGPLHVIEHEAMQLGPGSLRRVTLRCGACGRDSQLFFRVRARPS